MKGVFSIVTIVCMSLAAANPLGGPGERGAPLPLPALPSPPPDVQGNTDKVKVTANKVRGKSWSLYNYVLGKNLLTYKSS